MAALRENLLLHGHLTSSERNTFSRQREHGMKKSVMHLQQHWLHLKERENKAQQRNRLLLQQFDKAQDTLKQMLACNAAMKTIRMEYEKYLEERAPYWQQQFKEKSEAAQRKKMEECLRSYLKTEAEQMTKSSAGLTRMPQKVSAPQENNQDSRSDYNQDISYLPSTWLTHLQSQTACLPFTEPSQWSSRTSSAIVTSEATKVQRSESDDSSQKSSTNGSKRTKPISRGSAAGSLRKKKVVNQKPMAEGNSSEVESCSAAGESVSHSEESRSEDAENQSPCDEQSSTEEEDEEEAYRNNLEEGEDGDEKMPSQRDEEQEERHVEGEDEVPDRKSTPGEEEETETEEELEDQGDDECRSKDEHGNHKKKDSSFSQDEELDEDDHESDGKKMGEEEEESDEEDADKEEEQKSDEAEEDSDSDDSIISPQAHKPKLTHIIPEEAAEDGDGGGSEKGSITGSSDQDSNEFSDDDIENLLAPQEQMKKVENDLKMDRKPKASCNYVEIQVEQYSPTRTVYQSDSDEFDHFYD